MKKNVMKKVSLCCLFVLGFMFLMPNVSADVTCSVISDVAIDNKIVEVVHTIILAIQIVVPIVLVIFGMIDLAKAVMGQKEDEIKKGQQTLIKRVIAAAIVFFVVTIVKMLVSFLADGTGAGSIYSCVDCFIEGKTDATC